MSALYLKYDAKADCLRANVGPSLRGETVEVQQGKLVLSIDRIRKLVASFEVADFRHFVSYQLLDELFGDQVVREIAAFQSAVTATSDWSKEIQVPEPPSSSRRVVEELLRAA